MSDVVKSVFGLDPAEYSLAQQKMNIQAQSGMTPYERMGYNIANIGGSLFGVEDAYMKKASSIQAVVNDLSTKYDPNSPEFYKALSSALPNDMMKEKVAAAAYGRKIQAETTKEELAGATELQKAERYLKKLTNDPNASPEEIANAKKNIQVILEGKAPKVNVAVHGQKNVLDVDKKDAETLLKVRDSAESIIPRLQEQSAALQKGMIAGNFADGRTAFANALAGLGIKDKGIMDKLANTKTFNANRIELASSVAKQLGVNPTDRDFQASLQRFASNTDAPETSAAFINDMLAIQQKKLDDANRGLNYYRKNEGSFAGYDRPLPTSPVVSAPEQSRLDKLKQELKNRQ